MIVFIYQPSPYHTYHYFTLDEFYRLFGLLKRIRCDSPAHSETLENVCTVRLLKLIQLRNTQDIICQTLYQQ